MRPRPTPGAASVPSPVAPPPARVRVKICGLARREDAVLADELGADYLGLVLTPGFTRSVAPAAATELVTALRATKVAVLVNPTVEEAAQGAAAISAGVLQLHGDEDPALLRGLRARGEWILWKAVRARSVEDVLRAVERYGAVADGLLLEGHRDGVVGGGGAGLELDAEEARAAIPPTLAFVLAGGLEASNVARAVALFHPDVVDVSSGVEAAPRHKSAEKLRSFLDAARGAARYDPPSRTPSATGHDP